MRLGTCNCISVELDTKYGKFQRPHSQGKVMCKCLNCGNTHEGFTTEYTEPVEKKEGTNG